MSAHTAARKPLSLHTSISRQGNDCIFTRFMSLTMTLSCLKMAQGLHSEPCRVEEARLHRVPPGRRALEVAFVNPSQRAHQPVSGPNPKALIPNHPHHPPLDEKAPIRYLAFCAPASCGRGWGVGQIGQRKGSLCHQDSPHCASFKVFWVKRHCCTSLSFSFILAGC